MISSPAEGKQDPPFEKPIFKKHIDKSVRMGPSHGIHSMRSPQKNYFIYIFKVAVHD